MSIVEPDSVPAYICRSYGNRRLGDIYLLIKKSFISFSKYLPVSLRHLE